MGGVARRAGSDVCPDRRGVPGAAAIAHQTPGVERCWFGSGWGGEEAGVTAGCYRRPGGRRGGRRLHVGVTVTASMRHPLLGYSSLQEAPEGAGPTGGRENKAGK